MVGEGKSQKISKITWRHLLPFDQGIGVEVNNSGYLKTDGFNNQV